MNTKTETAKKLPLIIILIGTSLLAIPAALGTFALIEDSSTGLYAENFLGNALFLISICGFILFAGYILTAIFQKHSKIFWLCSAVYNFCISAFYGFFIIFVMSDSANLSLREVAFSILNPIFLLSFWTIFVTISSFYYFKFALRTPKTKLP